MWTRLWADLRYRGRALIFRSAVEQELDEELRYHLEKAAEHHRAQGLPAEEAMRRARVEFGGAEVVKDASRDGRGLAWLEQGGQDLRYGLRALRRSPGFAAAVIVTLGLGIGINAAMFGIVDRLLFRTPPFLRQPGQVHRVYLQSTDRGELETGTTIQYTRYLDLRQWATAFSDFAGYSVRQLPVGVGTGARERPVGTVSATLFDFFDAAPVLGRFFTAQEDTVPVGAPVAVLSYGFWRTQYGGREEVLGQTLRIGTADYTIIGVAPREFEGIADEAPPVLFVPITTYAGNFRAGPAQARYYTRYNWSWMEVLVRRKPGVSLEEAHASLSQAHRQSWDKERSLSPGTPSEVARPGAIAGPVQGERGPGQSTVTKVAGWVSGVAVIVLLIACANVANLMLARAVRRRREIALRLALGVSRGRLFRQLLTESLLLAVFGGLVGLLLADWAGAVLRSAFLPDIPVAGALASPRTIGVAVLLAGLAGGLTGLAPLLYAGRTDLVDSLKSGSRDGGYRRSRARTTLLLVQIGLSVVLLVGAGLFVRSLVNVRSLRLGYDVDPVLYIYPEQRGARLSDTEAVALKGRLLEAARVLPGVEQAALGLTVPFWDTWAQDLFVSGIDSVSRLGNFTLQAGSPEFFATIGTRILRGRGIEAEDIEHTPLVVVVSQSMATTLWPGQEALGQCLRIDADSAPCTRVVGIAEDIRQNSITDDPGRNYYLPIAQFHPGDAVLFVRARGAAEDLRESVRRSLQPLMPGDGYVNVTTMRDIVGPRFRSWELGATMFVAFGSLALVLAAIGLYGIIAYDVVRRTHEIGIRIALGARVGTVVRLVLGDGLRIALVGSLAGSALAFVAASWIAPLLYDQSPRDPLVFAVVTGTLLAVAGVASAMPALRAARVNPNVALRTE